MAFIPGFNSRYWVGTKRLSVYGQGIQMQGSTRQLDQTCQEDRAKVFANGQRTGTAKIDFLMDVAFTSDLTTALTAPTPVDWGPDGLAIGATSYMILANVQNVTISAPVDDTVRSSIDIQPDGTVEIGVVIAAEA